MTALQRPRPLAPARGRGARGRRALALASVLACVAAARPAPAGDVAGARMLEEPPRYGVYYDRYEPTFYTGFAPRTLDPRRIHLHLGRGNQLRLTVVLADDALEEYARDLAERRRTYRALIDDGRLVLSQNRAFEEFEKTLREVELERLVAEEATLASGEVRARNLALLARLNPGRVFRIRMPVDEVLRRWAAHVRPEDRRAMDGARRLELVNLLLPTRLFVADLDGARAAELAALVRRVPDVPFAAADLEALRPPFLALLEHVAPGLYPARDGALEFDEFTAVYPVGTFNEYTSYNGHQIPAYPTPGRRALTTHQRTKTVDHVPIDEHYSYSPWIPYMHVGTRMHNAVHTLWWEMDPAATAFLPASWRAVDRDSLSGKPYRYLWLLSRGPMSHGCTHLNAGHIAELRQVLPSETAQLYQVDVFLNPSHLYDVFDVDGDLEPEVVGVRYFIAYALKNGKPDRLRARDERHAYYAWLYGDELEYDAADRGVFREARDCRFVGREPDPGARYPRIPLFEAAYEPERVQFYHLVDLAFAAELRKVGLRHPFADVRTTRSSARSSG